MATSREPLAEDLAIQNDELVRSIEFLEKIDERERGDSPGPIEGRHNRQIGDESGVSHERSGSGCSMRLRPFKGHQNASRFSLYSSRSPSSRFTGKWTSRS